MNVFALRFFKAFFEFVGWSSEYGAIVEFDLLVGKVTREFSCIEPKLLVDKACWIDLGQNRLLCPFREVKAVAKICNGHRFLGEVASQMSC